MIAAHDFNRRRLPPAEHRAPLPPISASARRFFRPRLRRAAVALRFSPSQRRSARRTRRPNRWRPMMTIRKSILGTAAILGIAAAPLAPAFAQEADTAPAEAPMTQEAPVAETASFTDEQLESFVTAAMAIVEIRQQYTAQIQAAEGEEAITDLQREAMTEMQAAITETENLDVETYNEIGEAVQTDKQVGERVAALVKEFRAADAQDTEGEG
ncbi:hypothetical protein CDO87_01900 [Sagittula sp. P11]|nr:hypothetical protein CDO87_01900 [Sagittula sp. P11]